MTDTEIDRRLALAIGYRPEDVQIERGCVYVVLKYYFGDVWKRFDYRQWDVIGPIAERYDLFPTKLTDGRWRKVTVAGAPGFLLTDIVEPTPQRAIALAALAKLEKT